MKTKGLRSLFKFAAIVFSFHCIFDGRALAQSGQDLSCEVCEDNQMTCPGTSKAVILQYQKKQAACVLEEQSFNNLNLNTVVDFNTYGASHFIGICGKARSAKNKPLKYHPNNPHNIYDHYVAPATDEYFDSLSRRLACLSQKADAYCANCQKQKGIQLESCVVNCRSQKELLNQFITPQQLETIDVVARTLYAEMTSCVRGDDNATAMRLAAMTLNNRAEVVRKAKEDLRAFPLGKEQVKKNTLEIYRQVETLKKVLQAIQLNMPVKDNASDPDLIAANQEPSIEVLLRNTSKLTLEVNSMVAKMNQQQIPQRVLEERVKQNVPVALVGEYRKMMTSASLDPEKKIEVLDKYQKFLSDIDTLETYDIGKASTFIYNFKKYQADDPLKLVALSPAQYSVWNYPPVKKGAENRVLCPPGNTNNENHDPNDVEAWRKAVGVASELVLERDKFEKSLSGIQFFEVPAGETQGDPKTLRARRELAKKEQPIRYEPSDFHFFYYTNQMPLNSKDYKEVFVSSGQTGAKDVYCRDEKMHVNQRLRLWVNLKNKDPILEQKARREALIPIEGLSP